MKLTANEIAFLSGKYSERTPLSLFANIAAQQDGSEAKSLAQKGVLANGALSPQAKEMLDIAASADRCARVVLKDSFCVLEKYAYRAGERVLLVENDVGDLLFSVPESWSKTMSEFSEFIGVSRIKNASFEIMLPADRMMVLLALIDLSRKRALNAYLGHQVADASITYDDIVRHLQEPGANSFVNMLRTNYNYDVPETEDVKTFLDELAGRGCIKSGNGYLLEGKYAVFANSFLIPETVVTMEAFSIDREGRIITGAALGVSAGVKDIVSFIFVPEGIELSSISGMQLLQMIENFLNCPDLTG